MNIQKDPSQPASERINATEPPQTTSTAPASSSAKSCDGQNKAAKKIDAKAQAEIDEMIAEYKRDAAKDTFVTLPPSPLILEVVRRDPDAVWKAIQKM